MSAAEPRIGGEFYHVRVKPGEIAEYVLLPGDPDRVLKIAKYWDEGREVSFHREFRVWTGIVNGKPISACSTGIGAPSTAIAIEELARAGCKTFIRVGSTGAIQKGIDLGDLIISTAAVRLEGTSRQYVIDGYPASADYEVVLALIQAAENLGFKYHLGISASTDSFYVGQGRKGFREYSWSYSEKILSDLQSMNVLNFEMESSIIFTLASIYGLRAGSVCAVFANRIEDKFGIVGEEDAIKTAIEAVKILYEWDELKNTHGKKYFYPTLLRIGR
ncbi:MAG: uridine phosphorylase [Thaumarchaeota archaeon]|jgi:uridine phosphorylase|nr:uridine phosphorylase [Candidatus Geocrenenecus arthurdayi]